MRFKLLLEADDLTTIADGAADSSGVEADIDANSNDSEESSAESSTSESNKDYYDKLTAGFKEVFKKTDTDANIKKAITDIENGKFTANVARLMHDNNDPKYSKPDTIQDIQTIFTSKDPDIDTEDFEAQQLALDIILTQKFGEEKLPKDTQEYLILEIIKEKDILEVLNSKYALVTFIEGLGDNAKKLTVNLLKLLLTLISQSKLSKLKDLPILQSNNELWKFSKEEDIKYLIQLYAMLKDPTTRDKFKDTLGNSVKDLEITEGSNTYKIGDWDPAVAYAREFGVKKLQAAYTGFNSEDYDSKHKDRISVEDDIQRLIKDPKLADALGTKNYTINNWFQNFKKLLTKINEKKSFDNFDLLNNLLDEAARDKTLSRKLDRVMLAKNFNLSNPLSDAKNGSKYFDLLTALYTELNKGADLSTGAAESVPTLAPNKTYKVADVRKALNLTANTEFINALNIAIDTSTLSVENKNALKAFIQDVTNDSNKLVELDATNITADPAGNINWVNFLRGYAAKIAAAEAIIANTNYTVSAARKALKLSSVADFYAQIKTDIDASSAIADKEKLKKQVQLILSNATNLADLNAANIISDASGKFNWATFFSNYIENMPNPPIIATPTSSENEIIPGKKYTVAEALKLSGSSVDRIPGFFRKYIINHDKKNGSDFTKVWKEISNNSAKQRALAKNTIKANSKGKFNWKKFIINYLEDLA